jgi:hypothetical protein
MNWLNNLASLSNVFEKMSFFFTNALNEAEAIVMLYAVIMISLHGLYFASITMPFRHFVNFASRLRFGLSVFLPFILIIFLVIFIHIVDIFIFSYIIDSLNVFPDSLTSFYFVGEMYTTVGYGSYTLGPQWKSLPLIIAFLGLLNFAISGSILITSLTYIVATRQKYELQVK